MKKTIYKNFDYAECDEFALFLNNMAAQGWHFKEWALGLVFEKGEPEKAEYAVEIFIHGKEEDMRPEPQTEEFAEYCEAAGWEFIDAKRKFCIFRKFREDAMDIVTPEERIENIKNAQLGLLKGNFAIIGVVLLTQFINLFGHNFKRWIFDGFMHMVILILLMGLFYIVYECFLTKRWAKKQIEKIQRGERTNFKNSSKKRRMLYGALVLSSVIVFSFLEGEFQGILIIFCIILAIGIFHVLISKFRPSRESYKLVEILFVVAYISVGIGVVFAIFQRSIGEPDYSTKTTRSVFGTYTAGYYKQSEEKYIQYKKYDCTHEWILDRVWKSECDDMIYMKETQKYVGTWDAKAVATFEGYHYMVRYEDCIGVLYNVKDLDAGQLKDIQTELGIR